MTIIAQSADGMNHEFPDGTNPAVIDKVMKDYATSNVGSAQQFDRNPMLSVFQPGQEVNTEAKQPRTLTPNEQAEDLVKSAATGVGKFAVSTAGMPADIFNFGQAVASRLMGETPEQRAARGPDAFNLGPTTQNISRVINDATRPAPTPEQLQGGEQPVAPLERVPRTTGGEMAERVGEYAPTVALGPGGVVRKTAMTVVPAVAGVAARNQAAGTAFEPYVEPIVALATGGVTAGTKGSLVKDIARGSPTHEAVRQMTDAMYDRLRAAGITYDPMAYQNMAVKIMGQLKQGGFRKAQAPLTADALDAIAEQLQTGKAPDYNDLESIRKTTSKILREKNATDTDKEAAGIVLDKIDEFMGGDISHTKSATLTPTQAAPLMKDAREMARRNILAKQIDDMMAKAETYQSGYEAGLRNQFSNYLRSNKAKSLTKEERAAFMEASKGNYTINGVNFLGSLGVDFSKLGHKKTLLPAAAMAALHSEPVTGAALVAASTGAKYVGRQMTKRAAERAKATVLAGRDAQKNAALAQRGKQINVMMRRLIAGGNARLATNPESSN